ncbi:hypothetical protein [Streptomyces sp. NPDC005507]
MAVLTRSSSLRTRETVMALTWARAAASRIVGAVAPGRAGLPD